MVKVDCNLGLKAALPADLSSGGCYKYSAPNSSYLCVMIRFLFKQPQPRRFEFKPRFYNETREFLDSRRAAVKREMDMASETGHGGELLRGTLRSAWRTKTHRRVRVRSNRNVAIIALVLFLVAYLLFRF